MGVDTIQINLVKPVDAVKLKPVYQSTDEITKFNAGS